MKENVFFMTFALTEFVVVLIVSFFGGCHAGEVSDPVVTLDQGVLRGRTLTTNRGCQYDSYLGIPYAKPPVGDLRFRDPQPAEKWNGVLDAFTARNASAQYELVFQNKYLGSEDCLYINVFVPKSDPGNKSFPVMVWFHGGGFIMGDGGPAIYGPGNFMEKRVILVTVNYRLGALGFLSLDTPEVPGNAGLKDQRQALKWVQKNIKNFDGDPKKVTIFGQSAGSAAVHYHVLSKKSSGLFSAAIMQSGVANCPWALQKNPVDVAYALANVLGFKSKSKEAVLEFLRSVLEKDLVLATVSPDISGKFQPAIAPVIESTFPNVEPFISRAPIEALLTGEFNHVPTIIGLTSYEGLVQFTPAFSNPSDLDDIKHNRIPDLTRYIPDELKAKIGEAGVTFIKSKIQEYYFPTTDNLANNLTYFYSDFGFVVDTLSALKSNVLFSPTYFYKFSFGGSKYIIKLTSNLEYRGAGHSDELCYLFDVQQSGINKIPLTAADVEVSNNLLELWTNFAKYRNPTPEGLCSFSPVWTPASPSNIVCLDIDVNPRLVANPFEGGAQFWEGIMKVLTGGQNS